MARLFVILAKRSPMAVIFRRGPSKWYHVIQWNTRRDEFVHGAWIKGRIYEWKCDISPDGKLLLYFVHQGSRMGSEYTDSWTAISRVPWLKALVFWPEWETYLGGGRFIDDNRVALRSKDGRAWELSATGGKWLNDSFDTPCHYSTDDVPDSDWCGRDCDDRVIFTRQGRLYRRLKGKDVLVADFSDLKPDPQPAPAWAEQPIGYSTAKKAVNRNQRKRRN